MHLIDFDFIGQGMGSDIVNFLKLPMLFQGYL